jgi:hypothetical protein
MSLIKMALSLMTSALEDQSGMLGDRERRRIGEKNGAEGVREKRPGLAVVQRKAAVFIIPWTFDLKYIATGRKRSDYREVKRSLAPSLRPKMFTKESLLHLGVPCTLLINARVDRDLALRTRFMKP